MVPCTRRPIAQWPMLCFVNSCHSTPAFPAQNSACGFELGCDNPEQDSEFYNFMPPPLEDKVRNTFTVCSHRTMRCS
ncbi:hypothetical protein B0H65DRAFT_477766 [Neurospora tetraspora]|uniref:Uncharacterized protein n=1 Tax=Neurospora tetraspora TaxID=94610 RepID=A0AAE0J8C2_9PEZI|nr:hypothetical protein B0H65DRAFT_477766 [Neurospora tetraspora]